MFYIYYGDDRMKISQEVKKALGEEYEIFDGENLGVQDIVNICQGASLFGDKRKILIRDLTPARKEKDEGDDEPGVDFYAEFLKYVDTPHTIVIWETVTPRRKSFKEFSKCAGVKTQQFKIFEKKKIFDIAELALVDGKKAALELKKVEDENDPYMFVGLLVSKLCQKYNYSHGAKEKRALVALSELDMQMKTTSMRPWTLLESFLLELS
ncbi:hypothetical protein IKG48_02450 [Candidatus Saccharibacteria bacterium]|nr:hypothetical protein [Candidatus Saccharibacteria bacterium]